MPGQHSAVSPGGRRGAGGGAASSPVRQLQARAASRSRDRWGHNQTFYLKKCSKMECTILDSSYLSSNTFTSRQFC